MTRPTINDIARAAGVSKGTVSRVLNGHSTVAVQTRAQVERVMSELNYVPDPAARHLSWRTGQTLGLSTLSGDPLLSPYQVLFRRALEAHTAPAGVTRRTGCGLRSRKSGAPSSAQVVNGSTEASARTPRSRNSC